MRFHVVKRDGCPLWKKLGLYVLVTGNDEVSVQVTVTAQSVPKGEKVPVGTTITLEFTDTAARD